MRIRWFCDARRRVAELVFSGDFRSHAVIMISRPTASSGALAGSRITLLGKPAVAPEQFHHSTFQCSNDWGRCEKNVGLVARGWGLEIRWRSGRVKYPSCN